VGNWLARSGVFGARQLTGEDPIPERTDPAADVNSGVVLAGKFVDPMIHSIALHYGLTNKGGSNKSFSAGINFVSSLQDRSFYVFVMRKQRSRAVIKESSGVL
jgi:hypothetical protein